MLQRVDCVELLEMLTFARLEPWGCEVEDWRFAMVGAFIANQWRGKGEPVKISALIPPRKKKPAAERRQLSYREAREQARAFHEAISGQEPGEPGPAGGPRRPAALPSVLNVAED